MNIGIFYICTGNYSIFWDDFYHSMEQYFVKDANKYYFVFTDSSSILETDLKNVQAVYKEKEGWPNDTLKRFECFCSIEEKVREMDYLFFFNANLKCVKEITAEEILPDIDKGERLVTVIHPGLMKRKLKYCPFERNKNSTAYVPYNCAHKYVQGCLSGGTQEAYMQLSKKLRDNICKDEKNGIVAIFHDESHLNHYIINREDVKVLTCNYSTPEEYNMDVDVKILSLDKSKFFDVKNFKKSKGKNIVQKLLKFTQCNVGFLVDTVLNKRVVE